MAESIESFAVRLLRQPDALVVDVPVLVWEVSPGARDDDVLLATITASRVRKPRTGEPVALQVRKSDNRGLNPFTMGVTLGRADNNDIPVDDASVSRFHAYFRDDGNGHWSLVDAESMNGTWASALKLSPNQPVIVTDGMKLRFGDVLVTFMTPPTFQRYLKTRFKV